MVKVISSKGGTVQVEIEGINTVINRLERSMKKAAKGTEFELIRNANFVQNEVQESIIGNRAETKSVDTGKLGNSIDVKIMNNNEAIIFPRKRRYINSRTTTEDVAKLLEFGTSRIKPRRHFRNTKARVRKKVVDSFKKRIKVELK